MMLHLIKKAFQWQWAFRLHSTTFLLESVVRESEKMPFMLSTSIVTLVEIKVRIEHMI